MKIRVYHGYYGCKTGCCGHIIEINDDANNPIHEQFQFIHRYDSKLSLEEWCLQLAQRIVKESWPQCYDSVDWSSLDCSEADKCYEG